MRGGSQTTFTRFGFFWPPTPLCLHFLRYKSLQEVDFFDHLPPSSCKRSLWTTPNLKYSHVISGFTVHRLVNWRGHKASTLVGGFQGKQDGYHCTVAAQSARKYNFVQKIKIEIVTKQQRTCTEPKNYLESELNFISINILRFFVIYSQSQLMSEETRLNRLHYRL